MTNLTADEQKRLEVLRERMSKERIANRTKKQIRIAEYNSISSGAEELEYRTKWQQADSFQDLLNEVQQHTRNVKGFPG